jgi:DNA-binding transcriptional LysR family regulator
MNGYPLGRPPDVSEGYRDTLPKRPKLSDLRWIAWAPPFEDVAPNPQLRSLIPDFRPAFTSDNFLVQHGAAEAGVGAVVSGRQFQRAIRRGSLVPLSIDLGPHARSSLHLVLPKSALEVHRVRVVVEALADEMQKLGRPASKA